MANNGNDDLVERSVCMQRFDPNSEFVTVQAPPPSNLEGSDGSDPHAPALTVLKSLRWPAGTELKVKFIDSPSPKVAQEIQQFANVWMEYANIKFTWVTSGDADIRITTDHIDDGSWSYVGRQAESAVPDQNQPTMHFGWFDDSTLDEDFSRTVTHEFGHALGCVHEHINPNLRITWIPSKVYEWFAQFGWSEEDVNINFNNFHQLPGPDVRATAFDSGSIMSYSIHSDWNEEGISVVKEKYLSATDKAFIGQMYPR